MVHPDRIALARKRRGLTKKALAERLKVAPLTLTRHEQGATVPSQQFVERLALVLEFPASFFVGADADEPTKEGASFRSMSSMLARERDAALAAGAFAFMLSDWIDERFELPSPDLLDLSGETPAAAARMLREHWALGESPIRKNLIGLLEAKGVRVFTLAEQTRNVDAFSLWRRDRPFVFLNTGKSSEHSRFDAAHELAHLVLHRHGSPEGREAENEAQAFASSFLMPSADVVATLPRVRSINQMIEMKKRWGVSVAALNYRLHKLRITSDWQYRTFCIEIAKRGFREREPAGMARELSIVWEKILRSLWQEGVTREKLAEELALPIDEITNLLFGLADRGPIEVRSERQLRAV